MKTNCTLCDAPIDTDEDEYGIVEDDHAIYSGYNLRLKEDSDAGWALCDHCRDEGSSYGDVYVIAAPRVPDDPEAGGVETVSGRVNSGVLFSPFRGMNGSRDVIEPESPHVGLIEAVVLGNDLPTDWSDQFAGVESGTEWETLGTGWHPSIMDTSDFSETINGILNGDVGVYGPVMVRLGETKNVCSTNVTVWIPRGVEVYSKEQHKRVPFKRYLKAKHTGHGQFE